MASIGGVILDGNDRLHKAIVSSRETASWTEALEACNVFGNSSNRSCRRIVLAIGGRTVVLDPEMVMWTDNNACAAVSESFDAPVFAMCCAGVVGAYDYSLVNHRKTRRVSFYSDAGGSSMMGEAFPEEDGVHINRLDQDGVFRIMERLGVPYSSIETASSYHVVEISLRERENKREEAAPATKAPWWRFW